MSQQNSSAPVPVASARLLPRWQRWLWMVAGGISLIVGVIGLFLPLLPTTPLVLLSAFCFSRGCERCERWLIEHRVFGPMVRDWRATRSVPLRAKQIATLMMAISSIGTACFVAMPWGLLPGVCCALVAVWLWRLPTAGVGRVP